MSFLLCTLRFAFCILPFALAACWPVEARADSGSLLTASVAGLDVQVDTRWLAGGAYRPVKIIVTPTGPVTADRTLTVVFFLLKPPWANEPGRIVRRVAQDVEIPAGSAGPIRASMALPTPPPASSYTVQLSVGQTVTSLAAQFLTGTDGQSESLPRVLVVGDSGLSTSGLTAALAFAEVVDPARRVGSPATSAAASKPTPSLPTAIVRSATDLSERWIEYTNCDMVFLSLDELRTFRRQNPQAFQAVLAWTRAGGNLLVYGVKSDWSRLEDLESLLEMTPRAATERGPSRRGWREPDKSAYGLPIPRPQPTYPPPAKPGEEASRSIRAPQQSSFLMREHDLGMVVAIASDWAFAGDLNSWSWLFNSLDSSRWMWSQRHGLSMVAANPEFWKFQIPGVGLPPVNAFRVLISLFVLAIGPLNYWLLRRRRRLHLLVVTIPAGAAAVTVVLFGYALIADGLGTRVRVRSAAVLDQGRGRAACWARLSYYSGLAVSGGLAFPADVAVLPFEFLPGETSTRVQEMLWNGDQHLVSGWLPARTPTQLLTVRSRASSARLEMARPAGDAEGLEITNRLGARIERLLICAEDGKHYAVEVLEPGATVRALATDPKDATAALRAAYQANQPEYPPGVNPARLTSPAYRRRYGRYWYPGSSNVQPTQQSSRLERAMEALGAEGITRPLRPRHYLAIVESSPEVVLGTAAAREEASFHVILGQW